MQGQHAPHQTLEGNNAVSNTYIKHKSIKSLNVAIHIRATAQKQLLEEDDMKAPPKAPNMVL